MITLKQIEKEYGIKIKRKFKRDIEKYIDEPYIQNILGKALKYELTKEEVNHIFEIGLHKSKLYPHLYYLALIYIHPITQVQSILKGIKQLGS